MQMQNALRLLFLGAELMIHFTRELSDLFSQTRDVHEWREVAFCELADPLIHPLLRLAEAHV